MKITKLSLAAIAAMAFTTAQADMVSNVKLDSQAKVWYETWDKGDNELFDQGSAGADAVLKVGGTANVGPLKVGAVNYTVTTLGLEQSIVSGIRTARSGANDTDNWFGEAYVEGGIGQTTLKLGRQSLNTPFAFTENWNAVPNTFEAVVAANKDIENVTLIGAMIKKGNSAGNFKVADNGEFSELDASMVGVSAKFGSVPVNAYYYDVNNIAKFGTGSASDITAYWLDATAPVGPAKVTAIYANAYSQASNEDNAVPAFGIKATGKVNTVSLLAAYSTVDGNEKAVNAGKTAGTMAIANVATGFKKTKLPTAGVYTDGLYVAQPGSNAFKLKAATKLAGFGVAAQVINNTNDIMKNKETTEFDLIVSKKIGNASIKGIFLNRSFEDEATDKSAGGNHVRVIAAYNF
ncbi:MAG TPA: hypothetical protein ENK94_02825 [Campylobacterales bacterium]|nr:hypothetical protein [Campylobacterales bacterium]